MNKTVFQYFEQKNNSSETCIYCTVTKKSVAWINKEYTNWSIERTVSSDCIFRRQLLCFFHQKKKQHPNKPKSLQYNWSHTTHHITTCSLIRPCSLLTTSQFSEGEVIPIKIVQQLQSHQHASEAEERKVFLGWLYAPIVGLTTLLPQINRCSFWVSSST